MDTVDTEVTRDGASIDLLTLRAFAQGQTNLVAEKLSVVMAREGLNGRMCAAGR